MDFIELVKTIPVMTPQEHPSCEDILAQQGPTLKGKTALVTGGSSGIGVNTVRALVSAGARVFVAARDVSRTKEVFTDIADQVEVVQVDLESLASVASAADDFLSRSSQLNVLVCNAGLSSPYKVTSDGYEAMWQVNHLSHFLLFKKLLPLLIKSSSSSFESRVVIVSSGAHNSNGVDLSDLDWKKREFDQAISYAQSKSANIYMMHEIERRYSSSGVHALALAPGMVNTNLLQATPQHVFESLGLLKDGKFADWLKVKTLSQGAATSVCAAIAKEYEGKGGIYLDKCKISSEAPHAKDPTSTREVWEYSEKEVEKYLH